MWHSFTLWVQLGDLNEESVFTLLFYVTLLRNPGDVYDDNFAFLSETFADPGNARINLRHLGLP